MDEQNTQLPQAPSDQPTGVWTGTADDIRNLLSNFTWPIKTNQNISLLGGARLKIPVFDTDPATANDGEIAIIDGVLKIYTGGAWVSLSRPRVASITSASSYTLDTDLYDCLSITALTATLNTLNASGSPWNFKRLTIRIKDSGSSQTITWGSAFSSGGANLPTSTVAGKTMMLGFIYDSVAAVWKCVAYVHE